MSRAHRLSVCTIIAFAASGACTIARAADPFGFYLGAGGGHSEVRSDLDFGVFGPPYAGRFDVARGATGWKAIAGLRPLSVIGAEAEYIDFGRISGSGGIPAIGGLGGLNATARVSATAPAAFVMLYLPIRSTSTRVAYGAGVQLKFERVGVRAEYERVHASHGDPELLSVSVIYGF